MLERLPVQPILWTRFHQPSYKKSIGDSHDNVESGAKADAAQVNHNTDSQANSYDENEELAFVENPVNKNDKIQNNTCLLYTSRCV